ncbi:MAG: 1-(5-phosphoribosyl)-5-[(5-phosphoribosylamino)methylideneamino]imidazole-4-carboxamide isomerase [Deltaproteobacteria bacterium]|nr:1-(5-phosphoribosyl)-5-[(5-phosphoribosylamino)methylideneamino]imidazole-4-carboxamide isomerase [Deltaproteobacteria bacterium]MBW1922483.1 1-(5-phosphoribosyl)-5-[(5-phosphoribosylamino)methylideneamino]imidazole-4-carboxamide isomerase [Deltaproteobacteria bacterium]MBW1948332.1 1-(5-phosphoribosyl)-5-[(5-phosphoribosylamino)methylideneamino]imidazole-4-carboxamide isomerase [Deltaproteobacteria bacterium]MBW2006616.1 1-(5-phosphoribosyl)-5-[(5-phosphoribosylamino)methylideneamino]imidazo
MLVIPAVDIKDGRCVRLEQGRMSRETVFSESPERMAEQWYAKGAQRLHVVDLDGAVGGRPVNRDVIRKIAAAAPIPVQIGGGIRDMETLEAYLELGVQYAILGTAVHKDPGFVAQACERHPGRVILGIDARKGRVAVEGWTEETTVGPVELAKRFEEAGVAAVIYTDIQRDGMRTGPNVEGTRQLARAVKIPVIASGGISDLADVLRVKELEVEGVVGMITGRALYDGSLDLAEAIRAARQGSEG